MSIDRYLPRLMLAIAMVPIGLIAEMTAAADVPADPSAPQAANQPPVVTPRPKYRLPVVPKLQRYAKSLVRQYDTNGDGSLQAEEWAKMQGDPRLIDVNHDTVITVAEMARYISHYGLYHRIHLAVPPQSGSLLLTGLTPSANNASAVDSASNGDGMLPLEAAYAADEEMPNSDPSHQMEPGVHDLQPRSLLSQNGLSGTSKRLRSASPWTQKFHVSLQTLPAGLPDWFLARDLDGDGQVSLHEFAPEATRKDIEEFSRYDVDHDGVITPTEAVRSGGRSAAVSTSDATIPPTVKRKRRRP